MKKLIGFLVLSLIVCGFAAAQTPVTKNGVTIEYDGAKKVVRLTNSNTDPFTVQYIIDGKGKSVVLDKNAVWEQDFSKAKAAPAKIDLMSADKGGKAGAVDKDWKAAAAPAPAAKTDAKPADAKAAAPAAKTDAKPVDAKAAAPAAKTDAKPVDAKAAAPDTKKK